MLAADSAVTLSNGSKSKIFNSAKKIFTLSAKHSIGIMIYGNAELCGVPLEIIIKEFRQFIDEFPLDTCFDYKKQFLNYLNDFPLFKENKHNKYIERGTLSILNTIMDIAKHNEMRDQVKGQSINNKFNLKKHLISVISDVVDRIKNENFPNIEINEEELEVINKLVSEHFLAWNLEYDFTEFSECIYIALSNGLINTASTGIVIAGYGKKEFFPSIYNLELEGILNQKLIYNEEIDFQIDLNNNTSALIPFAQQEMVKTIMNGIDPNLNKFIIEKMLTLASQNNISQNELEMVIKEITEFQHHNFNDPVLQIINMQPIEEMASTAKTFIDITSFKRKIINTLETVGGPIDVLAITKGDGPIWIERKFYFDIDKNIDYKIRKEQQKEEL